MSPSFRRLTTSILILAAAGCIASLGPRDADDDMRDLVEARARWNTLGVTDYDMAVRVLCFCVHGGQQVRISVRSGSITGATHIETGRSVDTAGFRTVEGLFDTIEDALRRKAVKLEVTYDAQRGYPQLFNIDYSEMIADEEYGHEVVSFQAVTR
jgi:hypothetical protein